MKHRDFDDGERFYASWTDAIQEYVSTLAANFRLSCASGTVLQVVAGAGSGQVAIGIEGRWRYISSTINVTITGSSEVKDIFAVAVTENDFVGSGNDPDETDYAFELRSVAAGGTPVGVVAYRKVGEVDWDGSKIVGVRQTVQFDSTFPVDAKPLRVDQSAAKLTGLASQVADILSVYKSDGTKVFGVGPNGELTLVPNVIAKTNMQDNSVGNAELEDGSVNNAKVATNAAIALTKLAAIAAGRVLMGNGSNVPTATEISGDLTLSAAGVATIANTVITNAKIATNAAIAHTKLADITAGRVLMGNASNVPTATAITGDATLASDGTLTISPGAVTSGKIGPGAVTSGKIGPNAVDGSNITPNAVGQSQIATGGVGPDEIGSSAVQAYHIANDQVVREHIATNEIPLDRLVNIGIGNVIVGNASSVPTARTMTGDVTIDSNGVTTISAGAVDTNELVNDAVTTPKIDDGAVTTPKINDSAVTAPKIGTDAVTGPKIKDGEITNAKFAAGTLRAGKIGMATHQAAGYVASSGTGQVCVSQSGVQPGIYFVSATIEGTAAGPKGGFESSGGSATIYQTQLSGSSDSGDLFTATAIIVVTATTTIRYKGTADADSDHSMTLFGILI